MNNREEWSRTEQEMQKMLDDIRKEYPDFWAEEPELPKNCNTGLMRYQAEKARKRKRRNIIAACFAVCILGSTALTIFVNSDTAHAMKFALEKKYYEVTGMISTTDPEIVDEEDAIVVTITDENQIAACKKLWDGLMIPQYMPENYKFDALRIEKYLNGVVNANYSYSNSDNDIITIQMNTVSEKDNGILWTTSSEIRKGEVKYRLWKDEILELQGIDIILNDKLVSVSGIESDKELINIVEKLE